MGEFSFSDAILSKNFHVDVQFFCERSIASTFSAVREKVLFRIHRIFCRSARILFPSDAWFQVDDFYTTTACLFSSCWRAPIRASQPCVLARCRFRRPAALLFTQ